MRRPIVLLLSLVMVAACERRSPDRAPVVVGATTTPESKRLAELVATRLEAAECRVQRRFDGGSAADVDAKLGRGDIDVYVGSHAISIRDVLRRDPGEAPDNETKVRAAWLRRDLVWAPGLGVGDYAPVFRKDIDEKCRSASRTLMRMAYAGDPGKVTR
jgi:glycine betaine/choline ABC-type transport system substrate-binding protein